MKFHVCWTIDCESSRADINDVKLGHNAISGFSDLLEEEGWAGTFFLVDEELEPLSDLLGKKKEKGHELAFHPHPDKPGGEWEFLGVFSRSEQKEIAERAIDVFDRVLGHRPTSFRPGYASANDHTFPVFAECGFRQSSASLPGRKVTALAANWAGAPLFAHYTHPSNRFLTGGLDFVEIPISVDWESMIWGGLHPQDVRVEFTDAKNHAFTIRKIMKRQVDEGLPLKALVVLTHNLFRYGDEGNFRRDTMLGMIKTIRDCATEFGVELVGSTIDQAASAYRQAVPFQKG